MEDARDDLSNRSNAVGELLLVDEGCEAPVTSRSRRGQIQQVANDALPNGRKRVSSKFFEDVVQTVDRFLGKDPGHGGVLSGYALHSRHVHEVRDAISQRLYEDRRRTADECGRTQQAADANVADGDLTAVARVHVHAEQPSNDDPEALYLRFGVDRGACRDIRKGAARRETLHGVCRQ